MCWKITGLLQVLITNEVKIYRALISQSYESFLSNCAEGTSVLALLNSLFNTGL
jgi:hypothetical protein